VVLRTWKAVKRCVTLCNGVVRLVIVDEHHVGQFRMRNASVTTAARTRMNRQRKDGLAYTNMNLPLNSYVRYLETAIHLSSKWKRDSFKY
jgi:hypothetical protein